MDLILQGGKYIRMFRSERQVPIAFNTSTPRSAFLGTLPLVCPEDLGYLPATFLDRLHWQPFIPCAMLLGYVLCYQKPLDCLKVTFG